jgi:hypothetical protein
VKPAAKATNDGRVEAVLAERAKDYGSPETNFARIAAGWSQIFGVTVTPVQVALAQDWVKTTRLIASPTHPDSWLDKKGYTDIGENLALPRK